MDAIGLLATSTSSGGSMYQTPELYDSLPKVGDKVAARRMGLVGHCSRHPELPAGKIHGHMLTGQMLTPLSKNRTNAHMK